MALIVRGTGQKPTKRKLAMDSSPLRPSTEFRIDPAKCSRDPFFRSGPLCHEIVKDQPWNS